MTLQALHLTKKLDEEGYAIAENIYTPQELDGIVSCINSTSSENEIFLRNESLFAIRRLFQQIPNLRSLVLTDNLKSLITNIDTQKYFLTKALYFDKPRLSNWFVPYHQDVSISVKKKYDTPGYSNWTFKKGQYGVHPPVEILKNTITLRIHIDNTTEENGALRVIPQSHKKGIILNTKSETEVASEVVCNLNSGDVMLMKPLLLHASSRSTNDSCRRVIHLEFCNQQLSHPLEWLEYIEIN